MTPLTNLRELLHYDHEQGVLRIRDLAGLSEQQFVEFRDAETVAATLAMGEYSSTVLSLLAGYGLALAARAWQRRQPDARRAAMIQTREQLRSAHPSITVERMLNAALQRADAAVFAGADAERAVTEVVDEALRQADRAAERCGRRAAELLQDNDVLVTHGPFGPAWWWMIHAAQQENKQLRIVLADEPAARQSGSQAQQFGITLLSFEQTAPRTWSLFMVEAEQVARDGSVSSLRGTRQQAEVARQHSLPCYVLGAAGPDADAVTAADLFVAPSLETLSPELVSAIVTDRGIYRPAMVTRYFDDGNAPLDVIPLT